MSSIKFACKECSKTYKVPEKYAGKRLKCKACGADVRVPSESQSGVSSKRAAAVSKRSIAETSGRVSSSSSSKSGRSSSSSSRSSSSKSGRSSTSEGAKSVRAKKASAGASTERFKAVDLEEGNKATDLNSKNGLVVNGRPVRRVALRGGDLLQLGQAILRLDC